MLLEENWILASWYLRYYVVYCYKRLLGHSTDKSTWKLPKWDRFWQAGTSHLSILLLAALRAKLIVPLSGLQVDKQKVIEVKDLEEWPLFSFFIILLHIYISDFWNLFLIFLHHFWRVWYCFQSSWHQICQFWKS